MSRCYGVRVGDIGGSLLYLWLSDWVLVSRLICDDLLDVALFAVICYVAFFVISRWMTRTLSAGCSYVLMNSIW